MELQGADRNQVMSNDIHPAAAAAREIHRSETGQFGHQGRTTPADLAEVYDEDTVYDALMNDVVVLMGVDRDEFRAELAAAAVHLDDEQLDYFARRYGAPGPFGSSDWDYDDMKDMAGEVLVADEAGWRAKDAMRQAMTAVTTAGEAGSASNCFHPRSCQACFIGGVACGKHTTGTVGHENCTGTGPDAGLGRGVDALTRNEPVNRRTVWANRDSGDAILSRPLDDGWHGTMNAVFASTLRREVQDAPLPVRLHTADPANEDHVAIADVVVETVDDDDTIVVNQDGKRVRLDIDDIEAIEF